MSNKSTSILLWIISFILMALLAIYQRTTGPTYPVKGKVEMNGKEYSYKFLRTHDTGIDAPFEMKVPENVQGKLRYKRFKSNDDWTIVEMLPQNGIIKANIPHQPAAGKVQYEVKLTDGTQTYNLTKEPVIIRFKGAVPEYILIPHIFFMFLAMVLSLRTGFEAFFKRSDTYFFNTVTMSLFLVGGLILGPIVQKYAFDAYWTGWPFKGFFNFGDLTDNKTAAAFLFWLISWFVLRQKKENRTWPIAATLMMLAVYLIPHSMLGSEIDHTKDDATQTQPTEINK